ncbi:hypothetical protein [Novosphingobium sp. TH158]|uniref:hypothetical protein n=1 Tax=Novosphingobium sp. TH158 TaxID=2067455 RepID=UPI000C7E7686|nr:hypothetical protein [Novosphingobium sp. TH158]PLK25622.1 hypothetical protein C0V78_00970 [Novosphingobium sp. TH158]
MLEPSLDQALRRELLVGERLLWSASPSAGKLTRGLSLWLFAIPWTVFALFWESATLLPWFLDDQTPDAAQIGFGIVFPIFGLPFVTIGLWMLWRPIKAMRQARQTAYGLTDKRLIRLVDGRTRAVETVLIHQIGPVSRTAGPDGWGHLSIQTHSYVDSDGDRITERFMVEGVPEVATLERLLIDAAAARAGSPA